MAALRSGDSELRRARRAQMAVERGVRRLNAYRSTMELPQVVAPLHHAKTVACLVAETRRLKVGLLECQSRIGDGMFDDYLELIRAHALVDDYASRVLPHAMFTRAEIDQTVTPLPDAELTLLIQIVTVLLDELARVDSETER